MSSCLWLTCIHVSHVNYVGGVFLSLTYMYTCITCWQYGGCLVIDLHVYMYYMLAVLWVSCHWLTCIHVSHVGSMVGVLSLTYMYTCTTHGLSIYQLSTTTISYSWSFKIIFFHYISHYTVHYSWYVSCLGYHGMYTIHVVFSPGSNSVQHLWFMFSPTSV